MRKYVATNVDSGESFIIETINPMAALEKAKQLPVVGDILIIIVLKELNTP